MFISGLSSCVLHCAIAIKSKSYVCGNKNYPLSDLSPSNLFPIWAKSYNITHKLTCAITELCLRNVNNSTIPKRNYWATCFLVFKINGLWANDQRWGDEVGHAQLEREWQAIVAHALPRGVGGALLRGGSATVWTGASVATYFQGEISPDERKKILMSAGKKLRNETKNHYTQRRVVKGSVGFVSHAGHCESEVVSYLTESKYVRAQKKKCDLRARMELFRQLSITC